MFSNREAVASGGGGGLHSRRNLCTANFGSMMLCLLSLEAVTDKIEAMRVFARCMRGFHLFLATVIVAQISWLSFLAPKKIVLAGKHHGAARDFVRS